MRELMQYLFFQDWLIITLGIRSPRSIRVAECARISPSSFDRWGKGEIEKNVELLPGGSGSRGCKDIRTAPGIDLRASLIQRAGRQLDETVAPAIKGSKNI